MEKGFQRQLGNRTEMTHAKMIDFQTLPTCSRIVSPLNKLTLPELRLLQSKIVDK